MGAVKDEVSNFIRVLNRKQKGAKSLVDTIDRLESYLEEEPKKILCKSLDRLLTINLEAAKRTGGLVLMLISPSGRVSVGKVYGDKASDPWLNRLRSQGFSIVTIEEFSSLIESLKAEVAQGDWGHSVEFLSANREIERAPVYPAPPAEERYSDEPPRWKPSDFLPALPPHPPLPRGLFKD